MRAVGELELVVLVGGERLNAHSASRCTPPCVIHSPSAHHMADWPQRWRGDRGIMERLCEHGIGHPDPDDYAIREGVDPGVHGCDGCCVSPPVERPCGCAYRRLRSSVRWLNRCAEHAPMCRPLEQWEIDIFEDAREARRN